MCSITVKPQHLFNNYHSSLGCSLTTTQLMAITTFMEIYSDVNDAHLIFTSLAMPVELLAAWNGMSCMVSLYP